MPTKLLHPYTVSLSVNRQTFRWLIIIGRIVMPIVITGA